MDLKCFWVISKWAHCCWQRLRSRRAKKRRKREDKSDSSQINIPDISPPCLQSVNHRWISSDSCEIVERWCGAISQFCGFLKGRLIFSAKCFQHSGSVEVNSIKHSITLSQNSSSQVFSSNSSEHPIALLPKYVPSPQNCHCTFESNPPIRDYFYVSIRNACFCTSFSLS